MSHKKAVGSRKTNQAAKDSQPSKAPIEGPTTAAKRHTTRANAQAEAVSTASKRTRSYKTTVEEVEDVDDQPARKTKKVKPIVISDESGKESDSDDDDDGGEDDDAQAELGELLHNYHTTTMASLIYTQHVCGSVGGRRSMPSVSRRSTFRCTRVDVPMYSLVHGHPAPIPFGGMSTSMTVLPGTCESTRWPVGEKRP